MEMEEQYGLSDLRQLITRSTPTGPQPPAQFPPYPPPPPPDLFSAQHHHHHHNTTTTNNNNTTTQTAQLDMVVMGRHVTADILHQGMSRDRFNSDTTPGGAAVVFGGSSGFDSGAARWPRQETLTLLEVRSRLDHKFKEANQKGPLWDEVARIMSEEHGYQRSGKKCREKFENLYKYYKKTKEGKAGRQDGKHYRFFRQLEALYGDHSSSSSHHHHHHHHHHQRVISSVSDTYIDGNTPHYHPNNNSISPSANTATIIGGGEASLSLSSDFATSSSSDDEDGSSESERKKKRKGKQRSWKAKIKEFIDLQMRKIMEKQEAWLEKMMKAIEKRELERREREEEWKKQEIARIEREHKFWAGERAWIEARDTALMKALNKITSGDHLQGGHHWAEPEITKLIQLRTAMESRFEQCGFSEEVLWEDIAAKMAYFGYERSSTICKDKWDCITKELQDKGNLVKKRKDKNKNNISNNDTNYGVISNHNGGGLYINHHHHQHVISGLNHGNNCEINEPRLQLNDGSSSSPSSHNSNVNVNVGNVMNDSCLRFFLGDGDHNLGWESNYGVKTQHGS